MGIRGLCRCGLVFGVLAAQSVSALALSTGNGGGSGPMCKSNETKHCTLGPPPVCTCVPDSNIKKINKKRPTSGTGVSTVKSMNTGRGGGGGSTKGKH
jgi:hypothetical protein